MLPTLPSAGLLNLAVDLLKPRGPCRHHVRSLSNQGILSISSFPRRREGEGGFTLYTTVQRATNPSQLLHHHRAQRVLSMMMPSMPLLFSCTRRKHPLHHSCQPVTTKKQLFCEQFHAWHIVTSCI